MKIKITEHQIQSVFFEELFYKYRNIYPYVFSIPNGGLRNVVVASKLKREGVKRGVSDVFCAIPSNGYHGLWLEFKRPGAHLTTFQQDFFNLMQKNGYVTACVYSVDEALDVLTKYLNIKRIN